MSTPTDPLVRKYQPLPAESVIRLEELPVQEAHADPGTVPEIGGRKNGLEPTRYGDWEKNGRCVDF